MKNLILTLVVFSCCGIASAQTKFSVKNDFGGPIQGMKVVYHKQESKTDAQGMIVLKGVQKGDTVLFITPYNTHPHIVKNPATPQEIIIIRERDLPPFPDVLPVPEPAVQPSPDEVYTVVEVNAEFPGGTDAMRQFLVKNLHYPKTAIENELEGKCYLKFIVEKDGSISDIKAVRGVPGCPECDKEAIRVIKSMPKWKPAMQNGKMVRSYYTLPFVFKL